MMRIAALLLAVSLWTASVDANIPRIIGSVGKSSNILVFYHALRESNTNPYNRLTLFEKISRWNPEWAFIFPQAPHRVRCGTDSIQMWYLLPCGKTGRRAPHLLQHFEEARQQQRDVLNRLMALPQNPKVYLSGFSQGGALAMAAGLGGACNASGLIRDVDGILVFSGYVVKEEFCRGRNVSVLWSHHERDNIVNARWAKKGLLRLRLKEAPRFVMETSEGDKIHHFTDESVILLCNRFGLRGCAESLSAK